MSAKALTPVVVDASIAVKWLLPEPDSAVALEQRRRWTTQRVVPAAPDFLLIELHNVFWKRLQRGELAPDAPVLTGAPTFGLELTWYPFEPLLPLAWRVACQYDVSIYDALYAALAQQLNAPFATADQSLARRLSSAVHIQMLSPSAPRR